METNRLQNAVRAKIIPKLATRRSLTSLGRRQRHELGKWRIRLGHLLIRSAAQVAPIAPTVIVSLVLVTRPLGIARRVLVSRIRTVLLARPCHLIVRLPTGMHVVRTAPQQRVGEQHDRG